MSTAIRPIRRVVLVEPRSPDLHIFSLFALPRLGVVLLGTLLRDLGFDVKVWVEVVAPFPADAFDGADLVGFSAITPTAPRAFALADEVRARGIPVVLGGPHTTHRPDEGLEHADWVIRGEAEASLPALLQALSLPEEQRREALGAVAGLSWRVDGRIVHNPLAPFEPDLDRWPDPDLSIVEGFRTPRSLRNRRLVPIQTSRGCPFDCSFCSVTTTFGRQMRYRAVDRVVAEMARHDLAHTHFFFYDDNFAASPARTRALLAGMAKLPGRPQFSAQVRADVARDPALVKEMADAGCSAVYIGLESVNPASLQAMDKRQDIGNVSAWLDVIVRNGIRIHGMFIFGSETDDADTVSRTVAFARRHHLFSVQFLLLTPLPGSRWGDDVAGQGRLLTGNWSHFDSHHVTFWPAHVTPRELQQQQIDGHDQFYSFGEMGRRLLRGDWQGVLVTSYARYINHAWQRSNVGYLRELDQISRPRALEVAG